MMALAPPAVPETLPRLCCHPDPSNPEDTSARVRVVPAEQKRSSESPEGTNDPRRYPKGVGRRSPHWPTIC